MGRASRDERFVELVHRVTLTSPAFVAGLAPYLSDARWPFVA